MYSKISVSEKAKKIKNSEKIFEAIQTFSKALEEIDPNLSATAIITVNEYSMVSKLMKNIVDLDYLYSKRAFEKKPELTTEYVDIIKSIEKINNACSKQREFIKKSRPVKKEVKEEVKEGK